MFLFALVFLIAMFDNIEITFSPLPVNLSKKKPRTTRGFGPFRPTSSDRLRMQIISFLSIKYSFSHNSASALEFDLRFPRYGKISSSFFALVFFDLFSGVGISLLPLAVNPSPRPPHPAVAFPSFQFQILPSPSHTFVSSVSYAIPPWANEKTCRFPQLGR